MHQIGAGALGPVFRAYEPDQDRLVAVKLFRLDIPPERVHQLVAELEQLIAADLTHPSIAAPIATGISGTSAYFAQDFVAADSLDIVVRDHGAAPPADALRVAAQLGGALDFAATVGVVHGSLHPRDVLISPDDTRVIGLGVTRALERVGVATAIRRPYTAPERAGDAGWDRRADVYSLAALIFEMLVGKRLGAVSEAGDALAVVAGADAAALRRVFARALAEEPARRFATALEFADALKGALTVASHQATLIGQPPSGVSELPIGREIALPFDDPGPARGFEVERVFELPEPEIELNLRDEPPAPVVAAPPVVAATAARVPDVARSEAIPEVATPATAASASAAPEAEHRPARPSRQPARRAKFEKSAEERSPETEPEPFVSRTPTAFVDQSSEEFRESALEKTRSAVWPLVLAMGVGLVVGFAGGYGVAMRDRLLPASTQADSASISPQVTSGGVSGSPAGALPAAGEPPASAASSTGTTSVPAASSPPAAAPDAKPLAAIPPPAVPAAPTRAPEPAAPVRGRLIVRSTPADARVSVDGHDAGNTPATVRDLDRGAHTVRVSRDGFLTEERRITITTARPAQAMSFELRSREAALAPPAGPGGLMIESRPPGASVFIDGKMVGTTPMMIESVGAGDHSIGLTLDGYQRWVGAVRVATGERARVTASLER